LEPIVPKLILVPTDFSAPSAQALRYGAALAERFSAHLLVIYADPFMPAVDFSISAAGVFDLPREEMVESAREQLQTFAEMHIPAAVSYDVRVVVSMPVDAIVAQASEVGAGLIVMGTHGRTGLRRLLIGSVTEAVMRLAPVPVIVVHEETPLGAAAMRRIVSRTCSTKETAAAVAYARVFAAANVDMFPESADLIAIAGARRADLIVLGVRNTMAERIVQRSACPVLTANEYVARAVGSVVDAHVPSIA